MTVMQQRRKGGFYFAFDRIWILANDPYAAEKMQQCPDVPTVNKVALDMIGDLMQAKATAEAKLDLLKKAIESL